jgi:hypothetical protein
MVIAVAVLVLLVALTAASLSIVNMHLARRYATGPAVEELARAAVAQFIDEQTRFSQQVPPGSPLDQELRAFDFLGRYRSTPVFPDGGTNLPGQVSITFDTSQTWYSVDNTLGDVTTTGCQGQSVPPYAVDLVMTIQALGATSHCEAILQRRWPYVLTGGQTVTLTDAQPYFKADPGPAAVMGSVYMLGQPPTTSDVTVPVGKDLEAMLKKLIFSKSDAGALVQVGTVPLAGWCSNSVNFQHGNTLAGNVDVAPLAASFPGPPPCGGSLVSVSPGNTYTGITHTNVGTATAVQSILTPPAVPSGPDTVTISFPNSDVRPPSGPGTKELSKNKWLNRCLSIQCPTPGQLSGANRW